MEKLVKLSFENGSEILIQSVEDFEFMNESYIEVSDKEDKAGKPGWILAQAGIKDTVKDINDCFKKALGGIKSMASEVRSVLEDNDNYPDIINLEFGLKLGVKAGISAFFISSASGDAEIKISLTWSKNK